MNTTWSDWALDEARSAQDHQEWHVYRATASDGEYLYDTRRYPKRQYLEYVADGLGVLAPKSHVLIGKVHSN